MVKVKLGLSSQLYGFTQGAMAAGMITGGILIGIIGKKLNVSNAYILLFASSILLMPMGFAFSLSLDEMIIYWIILISCYVMMSIITMFSIIMMSFAQRETPNHLIGKIMSYILALTQCTLPIGQAVYGFIFEVGIESIGTIIFGTSICSILVSAYAKDTFKKLNKNIEKKAVEVIIN